MQNAMGVKVLKGLLSGGILKESGYSDHNEIHKHSHKSKVILSHLSTLPLLHMHLQIELQVARTGILHLFQSTRDLVGLEVPDRYQGSDSGRAGLNNLTGFVLSLTCWACCRSSMRSCKI